MKVAQKLWLSTRKERDYYKLRMLDDTLLLPASTWMRGDDELEDAIGEDNVDDLFELRIADASSNPKASFNEKEIMLLQRRISDVRSKDMALSVDQLAISGKDLMDIGIEKGPKVGAILNALLELVIEDPMNNDKDVLLAMAKKLVGNY